MKKLDVSTTRYPNSFALVDDDVYYDVSLFKWYRDRAGYVARNLPRKSGIEYLHRRIANAPSDRIVDHADRNPLNNLRANLRLTGRKGNAANMRAKARCGLKGVSFHPQTGTWRARVMVDGKAISLGLFPTAEDAHAAYVNAARRYFGEFARAA
jgi:hypothetical protein